MKYDGFIFHVYLYIVQEPKSRGSGLEMAVDNTPLINDAPTPYHPDNTNLRVVSRARPTCFSISIDAKTFEC